MQLVYSPSAGGDGGGPDSVSVKDGTDPAKKLVVDAQGRVGLNNPDFPLPADQVSDLKTVTLTNPTPAPETGLSKDATLGQIRDRLPSALDADGGAKVHLQNFPASQTVDTELPQPAALTDTDPNPTTPTVGTAGLVWNGSAWVRARGGLGDGAGASGMQNVLPMLFNGASHDRLRGDTANGLDVDVTRVSGTVAVSLAAAPVTPVTDNGGSLTVDGPLTDAQLRATPPTVIANVGSGTQPVSLASAPVTPVTDNGGTLSVDDGAGSLTVDGTVAVSSLPSLPAGGNAIGTVTVAGEVDVTPGAPSPAAFLPVRLTDGTAYYNATGGAVGATPTFKGRVCTFRTPGRAGTTGQNLLAIFNAAGSTRVLRVKGIAVDLYQTVIKAITVAPPIIRVSRLTAAPTSGTVLAKVAEDTALTTDAAVELRGDASADGTSSATALTATIGAGTMLTQEPAPRFITAAGYEPFDRATFFDGTEIVLRAGQGLVLHLAYTAATQNPVTDMWTAVIMWTEE